MSDKDSEEIQLLKEMLQKYGETQEKQSVVLADISKRLDEVAALADRLAKGFPNEDPLGHRNAHEVWIRKNEAIAEFVQKLTFELAKWGVIFFVGWAAVALWQAAIKPVVRP